MEKIDIQGRAYIPVHERVKEFRSNKIYENFKLISEIVEMTEKTVIFKASILNDKNEIVATGFAHEVADSSFINKTSHIENAETSAWGRALGCLGIGIDTSIATADEVINAQARHTKADFTIENIPTETEEYCHECGSKLNLREGQYGKFWSCSGYPKCKAKQKKYVEKKVKPKSSSESTPEYDELDNEIPF